MHAFQRFLEHAIVVSVIATEYLLIFDHWLITAPRGAPSNGSSAHRNNVRRRRWAAALRTTLAYAALEPVWYWIMTSTSDNASWWLLMAGYGSMLSLGVMVWMVSTAVEEMMGGCRREGGCTLVGKADGAPPDLAAATARPRYRDRDDEKGMTAELAADVNAEDEVYTDEPHPDDKEEKMLGDLSKAHPGSEQHRQDQRVPATNITGAEWPKCNHKPPWKLLLAALLPAASAAATNAALHLYTLYLASEDSQAWLSRTAFGWTVIALLCVFFFACAKGGAQWIIGSVGNRRLALTAAGGHRASKEVLLELVQRLSCLVILILVRAAMRLAIGQEPFVRVGVVEGSGQWTLQILGSTAGKAGFDSKEHMLDQVLSMVPPWFGWVWPLAILSKTLGTSVWEKWRKWRAERRAREPL